MGALDWTLAVRDIPAGGLEIERVATPAEREALARALDILRVESLLLGGRVRARAGGAYAYDARLTATVVQACVVSLEPVEAAISDRFDIDLRPAETAVGPKAAEIEATESLLDEPDVELIENGAIDLGRIAYEELASRLDPYPRLSGATLEKSDAGTDKAADHPFAGLAKLKVERKEE